VEKIAVADCPVLILGESGTGKELIALLLHYYSRRRNKPNVVVNCGAFTSDTLLASELFGHVRGAFTDARAEKRGKFEIAHTGTIFLDEVSCMSQRMQVALLRTLRYGEVQKIGDDELRRKVDVRIVSASNQDLKELIKNNTFREDVYYRLRVAEIRMPPLRERNGDTQLLTEYFLEQYSRLDGLPLKGITTEAMAALLANQWPDNVAGLENAIRSALLISNNQIGLQDLPEHLRTIEHEPKSNGGNGHAETISTPAPPESLMPLFEELETHERNYIQQALRINGGNVSRTAKVLGITRQGLQKKIRSYGLKNTRV
jgi:Nif-specific regulatory protein